MYYHYVVIITSCWSEIGMQEKQPQDLSLSDGCWFKATVLHEVILVKFSEQSPIYYKLLISLYS